MGKLFFSFLCIFYCIGSLFSQEKPRIAVIPLNAMGVSEIEADTASDLLEAALSQTDAFIIIEQDQVEKILEAQSITLTGNTDEFYATETGKLLSAEQIVIGSFSQIGTEYILTAKIIDISLGQNIRTEKVSFTTIDALQDSTELLARKLTGLALPEEESIDTIITEKPNSSIPTSNSYNFIYQIGIGSAYSFYFPRIETTVDAMDSASLIRVPVSIDFLFGRKLSDLTVWTVGLAASMDSFSASSESIRIFSFLLTGGFQFLPFREGLILGINGGINLLIPNTDLSYDGSIEFGSGFAFDIGYLFDGMKFGKSGITPGLGIKLIHSELVSGRVNQICGYITLGIR